MNSMGIEGTKLDPPSISACRLFADGWNLPTYQHVSLFSRPQNGTSYTPRSLTASAHPWKMVVGRLLHSYWEGGNFSGVMLKFGRVCDIWCYIFKSRTSLKPPLKLRCVWNATDYTSTIFQFFRKQGFAVGRSQPKMINPSRVWYGKLHGKPLDLLLIWCKRMPKVPVPTYFPKGGVFHGDEFIPW